MLHNTCKGCNCYRYTSIGIMLHNTCKGCNCYRYTSIGIMLHNTCKGCNCYRYTSIGIMLHNTCKGCNCYRYTSIEIKLHVKVVIVTDIPPLESCYIIHVKVVIVTDIPPLEDMSHVLRTISNWRQPKEELTIRSHVRNQTERTNVTLDQANKYSKQEDGASRTTKTESGAKVTLDQANKYSKQEGGASRTTKIESGANGSEEMSDPKKSGTTKASDEQFAGLKKGFLFASSAKSGAKRSDGDMCSTQQSPIKTVDDIPFIRRDPHQSLPHRFDEVQEAMKLNETFLQNKGNVFLYNNIKKRSSCVQ